MVRSVLAASFLTSSVLAGGYDPADAAQVEAWELVSACELLVGIGVYPGMDECIEALTIVDNPDPVGLRQERCRGACSVLDAGCLARCDSPVVRVHAGRPSSLFSSGDACRDIYECARACTPGCSRYGGTVTAITFRPQNAPDDRCDCQCTVPGTGEYFTVDVDCDEEWSPISPRPRPDDDDVALPGGQP